MSSSSLSTVLLLLFALTLSVNGFRLSATTIAVSASSNTLQQNDMPDKSSFLQLSAAMRSTVQCGGPVKFPTCCGGLECPFVNGVCCPGSNTCCQQGAVCLPTKEGEPQLCASKPAPQCLNCAPPQQVIQPVVAPTIRLQPNQFLFPITPPQPTYANNKQDNTCGCSSICRYSPTAANCPSCCKFMMTKPFLVLPTTTVDALNGPNSAGSSESSASASSTSASASLTSTSASASISGSLGSLNGPNSAGSSSAPAPAPASTSTSSTKALPRFAASSTSEVADSTFSHANAGNPVETTASLEGMLSTPPGAFEANNDNNNESDQQVFVAAKLGSPQEQGLQDVEEINAEPTQGANNNNVQQISSYSIIGGQEIDAAKLQ